MKTRAALSNLPMKHSRAAFLTPGPSTTGSGSALGISADSRDQRRLHFSQIVKEQSICKFRECRIRWQHHRTLPLHGFVERSLGRKDSSCHSYLKSQISDFKSLYPHRLAASIIATESRLAKRDLPNVWNIECNIQCPIGLRVVLEPFFPRSRS